MHYSSYKNSHTTTKLAAFSTSAGNGELHAVITVTNARMPYASQLDAICEATRQLIVEKCKEGYLVAMTRILLSDAANQAEAAISKLKDIVGCSALGYVQQAPMNGTKIAIVTYMVENIAIERVDDYTVEGRRGNYRHLWTANICNAKADTYAETEMQLAHLENMLKDRYMNIADNCVRTWFFVQNIDVNYWAVVKARRENFDRNGLTIDTHYIASTGIAGRHAQKEVTSIMDAYSLGGIAQQQMSYLYATNNMNRTSDYGVTFERGTYVDYGDRRHIFISGTASIDNKGNVVAEGDIKAQTNRMVENVDALLSEANATRADIAHVVVYLRDTADYAIIEEMIGEKLGDTPYVITLAPVCRPGWLIEMECIAITKHKSNYPLF